MRASQRAGVRLLLASSSVMALLVGGGTPAAMAASCDINITSGTQAAVSNSTAINCININGATISGSVVNTGPPSVGTITPTGTTAPTATGITINNATVGGSISNAGIITAVSGEGVLVGNNALVSGGVINTATVSAARAGALVGGKNTTGGTITITAFAGGISNSGTISAGGNGIWVGGTASGAGSTVTVSSFGGGISNSGRIAAGNVGIWVGGNSTGGAVLTVSTFSGGITNSGTISAAGAGIEVGGFGSFSTSAVSTFSNGITNSGTIVASGAGIFLFRVSAFSGGITNSGLISATGLSGGILLENVLTFTGDISNSGTISAVHGNGIRLTGIVQFGTSGAGGITNSGLITAANNDGINLESIGTYFGGISNSGTISAVGPAIIVVDVGDFYGGIVNSGTLFGNRGIAVQQNITTFSGGITNAGAISVSGIGIDSFQVSTFAGDITNAGTITAGATGIAVSQMSLFSGNIINRAGGLIHATKTGIHVGSLSSFAGAISNNGTISVGGNGVFVGGKNTTGGTITITAFAGGISNSGTISAGGNGIWVGGTASGAGSTVTVSSFGGGISNSGAISAGGVAIFAGGIARSGGALIVSTFFGGITNSGTISVGNTGASTGIHVARIDTFVGGVSNAGMISGRRGIFVGNSGATPGVVESFSGGISNSGTISTSGSAIAMRGVAHYSGGITNSGSITGGLDIAIGLSVGNFSGPIVNSGNIVSTGLIAINVSGANNTIIIDQTGGLIAGWIVLSSNADVLNISGGTINGIIEGGGNNIINFNLGSGTFTYAAPYFFDAIAQVNVNSGTVILDSAFNSANATTVNGGTLEIGDAADPAAALTSPVNVIGGTLAGYGTIGGAVTIGSGATLEPGSPGGFGTLSIAGNLTFGAGSTYAIDIAPGTNNNSSATVTGPANAATINGGMVVVTPQIGHYSAGTTYQILTTSNPLGGAGTFTGLTVNGSFSGTMQLTYPADDVDLDILTAGFTLLSPPPGLNQNERNVLNGINNAIIQGDSVPPGFVDLGSLSGPALGNALTALDGEDATGAQKGAFQLMQHFLNLLLDPSSDGGQGGGAGQATPFAPEQDASLPPDIALAYAHALQQKPPPSSQPQDFEQRWSAWASGFGGSGTTDGNATVGSSNVTATDYGYAAGMTYHVTPGTSYGFALAGGGTSWNLAQSLGSGRSDAFQAGVYGTTHFGPAYLSGALAFANHWFATNRIALGDDLTAKFQGQSYAARGEAGYRYAVPVTGYIIGITPYAALQVQDFHTPGYSETDLSGGGFGLTYNAVNATDTRSELGARFDNLQIVSNMPLVLRGRLAWAHDWVSNPALGAVFQALPGSNFTVNGAAPPKNSALTTAAAEWHLTPNWTAMAKFDGEFGSGSQTYAGTGTIRYSW